MLFAKVTASPSNMKIQGRVKSEETLRGQADFSLHKGTKKLQRNAGALLCSSLSYLHLVVNDSRAA